MKTKKLKKNPQNSTIKNLNPQFKKTKENRTLPFCKKLMKKTFGFTSKFEFLLCCAFSKVNKKRKRNPPEQRKKAIEALMQGMCFHYDPLANRVNVSVTTLAKECGLATESKKGNLSISRATRALESLCRDFNLITYDTKFDPITGSNLPSNITFTSNFFDILEISKSELTKIRNERVKWKNRERINNGLEKLSAEELIHQAFSYLRKNFRAYHRKKRLYGIKQACARRDEKLSKKQIENIVRLELTQEISKGKFSTNREIIYNEIKKRVKERMIMSRGKYTKITKVF